MPDDLTARRNAKTTRGVIACGPGGAIHPAALPQEDLDQIATFKAFLSDRRQAGTPAERVEALRAHFPDDPSLPENQPGATKENP